MGRKRIKQYLMLLLAIGVIAVVASGSGTFASFTAETQNDNNTFATGTLFLHNSDGTTTCTSESGSGNLQVSPACATLFSIANLAPSSTSTASLTLTNAGSVNSANIKWDRPALCQDAAASIGTLNASAADNASSLAILSLSQTVVKDTLIKLTDGSSTKTFKVTTTTASAGVGNVTTVPVSAQAGGANNPHTYATSTTVVTFDLGFTTTPALCSQLKLSIDEVDPSNDSEIGCVYPSVTNGVACVVASGTVLSSLPNTLTNLGSDPLNAGISRKFVISVLAPSSLGNSDMTTQAKFSLLWHLEQ
jgi:predicted ribosomally synthesized peptide with SipW-like signal peptide